MAVMETAREHPFTVVFDGPNRRGRFVLRAPSVGEAEVTAARMMGPGEHVVSVTWGGA
jgi:hypothetical protein